MISIDDNSAERRIGQARNVVLIAVVVAFSSAMLGVMFGILSEDGIGPDAWLIGALLLVSGSLMILVLLKPAMATSVVTAALTVYFAVHLNVGAIVVYQASGDFVRALPYVTWFFPLVAFHQFTNFGYYKRPINVLVNLSPIPTAAYVLAHPVQPVGPATLDAVVTFLFSFFAFVLFLGYFTRHREEEIERAARADEADRSAAVLRVSDERFRMLGLATNDLIWDADLRTGKTWWSESLLDTYGYNPRESGADPKVWESWIHPDERDRVVGSLTSVLESGGSNWSSEYGLVCADGRTLNVMARGLVLRDESGEPIRLIGSTTDVTELRDLEKKLRHAQKLEAVGQLTGGIAHDFNNLLTIILGSAETLADIHAADPESYELASAAVQAAERGAQLTSRLLSFARLQALSPEHRHPGELLAGIEGLIRRTIDEDIEISIRVAMDVLPVEVDPGQLENAVLNLVINARDAMPDGGRLTIEAANVPLETEDLSSFEGMNAGQYVVIAVSDNGCGM
ncbi:MAG TPA: PAS domain-containing protein, partial [Woeseiaceae bacterium]